MPKGMQTYDPPFPPEGEEVAGLNQGLGLLRHLWGPLWPIAPIIGPQEACSSALSHAKIC